MYDNPLDAIREYIQNSVDSIDEFREAGVEGGPPPRIEVKIDGRNRSLRIEDSGAGVRSAEALRILHDLGNSHKDRRKTRGFRGIGRLSGLAYCDNLRFVTKYAGEATISESSWDCRELCRIMAETNGFSSPAAIIRKVASFRQSATSGDIGDHYFRVEINGIRNPMNSLLNVPVVKAFVAQVAPVPFDKRAFKFAGVIDNRLLTKVPGYRSYDVFVNGQQVFKPYAHGVRSKGVHGEIDHIRFFTLEGRAGEFAQGWIGEWQLLGTIDPSSLVDGIRMRSGNMLIGDKNLLSEYFRERRFNAYLEGEIHITDVRLLPNSRRDNLEDGELRDELFAAFVREIGMPYSRLIRQRSVARSLERRHVGNGTLIDFCETLATQGYVSEEQKTSAIRLLNEMSQTDVRQVGNVDLANLLDRVARSKHSLEMMDGKVTSILGPNLAPYRGLFQVVYREMSNKNEASNILRKALAELVGPD